MLSMVSGKSLTVDGGARAAFVASCFPKRIEIPSGLWGQPVHEWQTSLRLANVLYRSGVRVLRDLHGRRVGDFAWQKNCGFRTLHELDSLTSVFAALRRDDLVFNGRKRRSSCSHMNYPRRAISSDRGTKPVVAELRCFRQGRGYSKQWTASSFVIPDAVLPMRFEQLPITSRLTNVLRLIKARKLGDLRRHSPLELRRYKDCGWRTIAEIQRLIERATAGEFDEPHIEERTATAELMIAAEHAVAKLSSQQCEFLLTRLEGLTFTEIGRRHGLTRSRAHQVVEKALATLRKSNGPRIPRLLETVRRRWMSIPNGGALTPALLSQWIGESANPAATGRLSREAQVRLIAALDSTIPCYVRRSPKFRLEKLDLAELARALRLASTPEIPRISSASVRELPSHLVSAPYFHRRDDDKRNSVLRCLSMNDV